MTVVMLVARPRRASTCTCAPRRCPAVVVTVLLGAATFAALGMAAVMLIPNAEAAPVVANVLILPLSFISGIWYPLDRRAGVARRPGQVLPGRAPGQRAARRLRPAQPRLGMVGQRPARGSRIWLLDRDAPGDALLAPGDGALSGLAPDRLQDARGEGRGHLRGLHLAARRHRAAGRRAQRGPARGRRRRARRLLRVLLPRRARADGSQAAGGRRARLRHRPGHRRRR